MKTELKVRSQRLAELMISAMEGNHMTRAWCEGVYLINQGGRRLSRSKIWYADPKLYDGEFEIDIVEYDEDEDTSKHHVCGPQDFANGLKTMADRYPDHFSDLTKDGGDAITADVFLQCVALKEVVYG